MAQSDRATLAEVAKKCARGNSDGAVALVAVGGTQRADR